MTSETTLAAVRSSVRLCLANIKRTACALAGGPPLLLGWFLGIVWHRLRDGMWLAKVHLDRLDNECIEKGWWIYGPSRKSDET